MRGKLPAVWGTSSPSQAATRPSRVRDRQARVWPSPPQLLLTGPAPLVHLFHFFSTLPFPARPLLPMTPRSLSFLCFHSAGTLGGGASSLPPDTPVHAHSPHFRSSVPRETREWGAGRAAGSPTAWGPGQLGGASVASADTLGSGQNGRLKCRVSGAGQSALHYLGCSSRGGHWPRAQGPAAGRPRAPRRPGLT